jgi:rare lipoprotein A
MGRGGIAAGLSAFVRIAAVGCSCVLLAQCSQAPGRLDPKYGVSSSPRLFAFGDSVPKGGGSYRVGKPYVVAGQTYTPEDNPNYTAEGLASWYGDDFHGRATANGEVFDMASISAAHPTLPIPSYARVTNLKNQKSIIVRVNDRGPYHQGRLIDVSVRTAKLLGFYDTGVTRVRVNYVGRASLGGSDDAKLEATLRQGTPAPGPSEVQVASARSFLPKLDMREPVPLPADRPYELGQDGGGAYAATARASHSDIAAIAQEPIAPLGAPSRMAATRTAEALPPRSQSSSGDPDRWEKGFASRFAPAGGLPVAPSQPEAISAFSGPAPSEAPVVNSHGIY